MPKNRLPPGALASHGAALRRSRRRRRRVGAIPTYPQEGDDDCHGDSGPAGDISDYGDIQWCWAYLTEFVFGHVDPSVAAEGGAECARGSREVGRIREPGHKGVARRVQGDGGGSLPLDAA